ncbi:DUF177 domain-containing protein [Ruminococcus sp.]|uniref:YceD family protein n=1 Tax=Ruminococcus sp. TaxID=41978 RepID=UPI002633C141|nr:DUF177 domain-containing protein [Ruminococcus sp.]MDD6989754.1 DUF177 domain-containing protein [Ruminococcus sp.]MDY6201940.1 DUF177 domain-containing protein [Ruminococcus sp.]
MLFELKSVFQNEGEEKQVNYKLDIADIDIDGVFPFRTPIDVTATAKNRASLVSLTIRACFSYSRSCDRCSTDFTREMDMLFEHKLAQTLVDDGNDDYIETPDFKLELDDIVISDILLSLPQKNLCKDDCKGLCQICGKNLNEGDCSCDKREIDPRLEMLKLFMD